MGCIPRFIRGRGGVIGLMIGLMAVKALVGLFDLPAPPICLLKSVSAGLLGVGVIVGIIGFEAVERTLDKTTGKAVGGVIVGVARFKTVGNIVGARVAAGAIGCKAAGRGLGEAVGAEVTVGILRFKTPRVRVTIGVIEFKTTGGAGVAVGTLGFETTRVGVAIGVI